MTWRARGHGAWAARGIAALLWVSEGCATVQRTAGSTAVATVPPGGAPALDDNRGAEGATDASLAGYCAATVQHGGDTLGIPLARAQGARSVTGDPAVDDTVQTVDVATRVGTAGVVRVQTVCGNAWLVAVRWQAARWVPTARAGLVTDARPGACRTTTVTAEGRGMTSSEPWEVVAVFGSETEEGDQARAPVLRAYRLSSTGGLTALSEDIAFGGSDDSTGAAQRGVWVIDEALLAPRELYVQLEPGRPGPGGVAAQQVVRRTYRLENGRLVLADETREAWRPPVSH